MTDPTQPTPEQTDPALKPVIKAIIEGAVGVAWLNFARRHPSQAEGILRNLGGKPIIPEVIAVLEKNEIYHDLEAATAAETDVANIVKGLAPIVLEGIRLLM